jgi:hypothetical protein
MTTSIIESSQGSDWGAHGDSSLLPIVHHVVCRVSNRAKGKPNEKKNPATSGTISLGANLVLDMLTKNAVVGLVM